MRRVPRVGLLSMVQILSKMLINMIETITLTASSYWEFYCKFLRNEWHHMTPMKYGFILIGIGVFGWLLMKSGSKKV
jgi:hypothetical protein